MRNLFIFAGLLLLLHSCASTKPPLVDTTAKQLTIVYDQNVREFPAKNPTNMVVPGIYLPLQDKAFQLDRPEIWNDRILILRFNENDDSSKVQIMANRFGYNNWLYTDTILEVKDLSSNNTCYKLDIRTYRSEKHGIVPQLKLVPFECNESVGRGYTDRLLEYDVATHTFTGNDKSIFLKRGYKALFTKLLIPPSPIIKVSDLTD